MTLSGGGAIAQIAKIVGLTDDFEQTRNALIANPEHLIRDMIAPVAPISDREDQGRIAWVGDAKYKRLPNRESFGSLRMPVPSPRSSALV